MKPQKIFLFLALMMIGCAPGPHGAEVRIADSNETKSDTPALGQSLQKRGLVDKTYINGETSLAFKKDGTFNFILNYSVRYHRLGLARNIVSESADCLVGVNGSASQKAKGLSLDFNDVKLLNSKFSKVNDPSIPSEILCREFVKRISKTNIFFSYKMFNLSYIEIDPKIFDLLVKKKNEVAPDYDFDSTLIPFVSWASDKDGARIFLFADDSRVDLTPDLLQRLKGTFNGEDLVIDFNEKSKLINLMIRGCKKEILIKDFKAQASLNKMDLVLKGPETNLEAECSVEGAAIVKSLLNRVLDFSVIEKSYLSLQETNLTLRSDLNESVHLELKRVL